MTIPSVKTIATNIEWLSHIGDSTAIAKKIRKVMEFWDHDDLVEYVISTLEIDLPSYMMLRSTLVHLQLWTIDRLLECHGIECIQHRGSQGAVLEYCNTGDTYMSTVAYDHIKSKFVVTSYGQWIERNDPNGTKY